LGQAEDEPRARRELDEGDAHGVRADVEVVHDVAEESREDLPVRLDDARTVVDDERDVESRVAVVR